MIETVNRLSLITSGASRCSGTMLAASIWDAITFKKQNCLKLRKLRIQILKFFLSLPKLTNFKRKLMKNRGCSRLFAFIAKSIFMQLCEAFKFQCYNCGIQVYRCLAKEIYV